MKNSAKILYAIIYNIGILIITVSCEHPEFQLQDGDLLFQVSKAGEMSQAITSATGNPDSLSFTHVAIVSHESDGIYALEAVPERGVTMTPLPEFLNNAAKIEGRPAVIVARLQTRRAKETARSAVLKAKSFLGQPYDYSFRPDNGKIYCSELVWESFRDPLSGMPLFSTRPMNFRAADGTMPRFWEEHFATLGEPIPEGVQGTNPNDLLREKNLKVIYRYYR